MICIGLGVSFFYKDLFEKVKVFLNKNFEDFKEVVYCFLGNLRVEVLDIILEENFDFLL